MPRYEFRCPKCGGKETRLVAMDKCDEQLCDFCSSRLVVVIQPVPLSARRATEGRGRSS